MPENRRPTAPPPAPAAAWGDAQFDALAVAVLQIRDDRILRANAAARRLFGAEGPQLVGRDVFTLVDPECVEVVRARYEARQRGEVPPPRYEITALRLDGQRVRLEIEPRIVEGSEAVLTLRELDDHVADRRLLSALASLAAWVQQERTPSGVIEVALDGLASLGFQTGAFRVVGEDARMEGVRISPELRALFQALGGVELEGFRYPLDKLPNVRRAILEAETVYLDDVAVPLGRLLSAQGAEPPPGFEALLRVSRLSSVVIAPLSARNGPWGFLGIAGERLGANDSAALSLFASQLASALEVAETIERLEQQNQKLEAVHQVAMLGAEEPLAELAPRMLRTVGEATGSDVASLWVLDADAQELVLSGVWNYSGPLELKYRRIPLAATATGTAAASMQPRSVSLEEWPEPSRDDVRAARFFENAILPLLVNGRLGGTINLARHDRRRYTAEELRSAQVLASQVALQVERTRSYAEARRRVEELSLINEVGGLINQHLELEHVLPPALRHVAKLVDVPNAFLMLLSADGKLLEMAATNVEAPDAAALVVPLESRSAASEAVRQRCPVVIGDSGSDPRVFRELASRFGHRALMAVPLMSEGKALGTLILGETRSARGFTPAEVDRAVAVANQLASAIDNARLYGEQRRRVEQLKVLLDISRLITGSLELQQILESGASSLVRMIDATDSFIFLLEDRVVKGVATSAPEFKEHFSTVRLPLSEPSAVGAAILSRAPQRFEDAEGSVEVNQTINTRYRQKSLLALPLLLREVPIGGIVVGDRRRKRSFTDDEVERALLIARQLAVAVDNARLFEDLKRSYHELARAQKELVRRERLVALGELSAVVAHEVRNPLGVIFNSLSALKRMLPPQDDARMLLGIVGEEADRLNRMVTDLLDFASPNEAQLQPESLDKVVVSALEAAARAMPAPGVQVQHELAPDLPPVPVDAHMLRRAVVNLVVNAIQAMPAGGTVRICSRVEHRREGSFARLEVKDNGPGIEPELTDRVFQPFFTTRAAGTGLGLAVVKRIADAHRADLQVKSAPGEGSTFTLLLPLAP